MPEHHWLLMLLIFISGCTCTSCYDVDLWLKRNNISNGHLEILIKNHKNKLLVQRNILVPEQCNYRSDFYAQVVKNTTFDSISVTATLFTANDTLPVFSVTEQWPGGAGMGDVSKGMPTVLLEIQVNGGKTDSPVEFKDLM